MKQRKCCLISFLFFCIVQVQFKNSCGTSVSNSLVEYCDNPSFLELLNLKDNAPVDLLTPQRWPSTRLDQYVYSELCSGSFGDADLLTKLKTFKLVFMVLFFGPERVQPPLVHCSWRSKRRYFRYETTGNTRVRSSNLDRKGMRDFHREVRDWSLIAAVFISPLAFCCFFLAIRLHLIGLRLQRSRSDADLPIEDDFAFDVIFSERHTRRGTRRRINRWTILVQRLSSSENGLTVLKRGLSFSEIQSIPTERHEVPAGTHSQPRVECAICLENIQHGDEIQRIPGCGHPFHRSCLIPWVRISATCPLCRRDVITKR